MPDQLELIQEAAKRGILPEDKKPIYDEAVKRGLIPGEGGGMLDKVADWADQPRPGIVPLKQNGDNIELTTPEIIAGPIGAVARGMRDVGTMMKGGAVDTEDLQKSASGVAGIMTGDAVTPASLATKGGKIAGQAAGKGAGFVRDAVADLQADDLAQYPTKTIGERAQEKVMKRLTQDVKGGGMTAQDALDKIVDARKQGKPMTLADVGEANIKGLAGNVARAPGESQTVARKFLADRDQGAGQRLTEDVGKALSTGSVKKTAELVADTRSQESKPLFEKAYAGGSMAPLEHQFGVELDTASKAEDEATKALAEAHTQLTLARGKQSTTPSVFSHIDPRNPVHGDVKEAQAAVTAAENRLKAARGQTDEIRTRLREAQSDRLSNAPGAIWNPRIQRLLDLPIVKSGINQGIKLERQNAAAEGRPFSASEYAIVGEKDGNPVVGRVPNMKLLASAKEGLDAILGSPEMRDPLTGRLTKEGVSVDKVRRALLTELKTANPDYAEALGTWAGHSASLNALKFGRNLFAKENSPEHIAQAISEMTPSEREFAKLGVADMLREKILRTGIGGDEAKHIVNSEWARRQLRPLFESDAAFNKFIGSVTDERTMFETGKRLVGGSPTAERTAEDEFNHPAVDALHGITKAAGGNVIGALRSMMAVKRDLGLRQNPQLNEAIARLLFDPELTPEKLGLPPKAAAKPAIPTQAAEIAGSIK